MDERDDWLEGVRRWYFGGQAPADAAGSELAWPRDDSTAHRCTDCAHRSAQTNLQAMSAEASNA